MRNRLYYGQHISSSCLQGFCHFFSYVVISVTRCWYLLPLYLSCPHLPHVRADPLYCRLFNFLHLSPSVPLCMPYIGVTANSAVLPRVLFLLISAICFLSQECAPLWPLCSIRFVSFSRSLSPKCHLKVYLRSSFCL